MAWLFSAARSSSTATGLTSSARSSNLRNLSTSPCTAAARSSSSNLSGRCWRKNSSTACSCSTGGKPTGGFCAATGFEPMGGATSTVPGKQRKGGQSAARFGRLREIAIHEFYTKVGERSSAIFLAEKDFFERFKGVLIGGPSPTKEEFEAGSFLHHEIQKRIVGLFDVAYTNEDGLSELVDSAKDALKGMTVIKEKAFVDKFLKELVKDGGLAAYGEESIRKNLGVGAIDTLLLSGNLRKSRIKVRCQSCGHTDERTVSMEPGKTVKDVTLGTCPKCTAPLTLEEETDIVDELTRLADQSSAKVEIISDDFEEGSILFSAFGGIAAILRYRTGL